MPIGRPIHKGEHAAQLVHTRMLNPFGIGIAPALQQETLRRTDDHIHGIDLMNHREQICLRRYQSPFIYTRSFDHPVDGRNDQCVIEIEFGFDEFSLRAFEGSFRSQLFGDGIIHIFRAHRLFRQERLHACEVLIRLDQPGF